jgi:excisionase family DNA binding protein
MTAVPDARATALSELASALVDALDERSLDRLAMALAPRLSMLVGESVSEMPWLDARGAAERLACSRDTVYELARGGQIPHHKVGTRWLFRPEELDLWVRSGSAEQL